jgi:uncharacterized protein YegL
MSKKKKKKKTKAILLLDRSGSMWNCRDETVIGYNEHVQQFQEDCKDKDLDLEVCLLSFNGNVFEHQWNVPAEKLQEATIESFVPGGATALRDAVGYAIDKVLSEYDPDTAYLFIIISDGADTKSQQYSEAAIAELLEGCEKSDNMTLTFMGCKKEDLTGAGLENLNMKNMAVWDTGSEKAARRGMHAGKKAAAKFMRARASSAGSFKSEDYYDLHEEVAELADEHPELKNPWFSPAGAGGPDGVMGPGGPCGAFDLTGDTSVLDVDVANYTPKGPLCSSVFETSNRVIGTGVAYSRPKHS